VNATVGAANAAHGCYARPLRGWANVSLAVLAVCATLTAQQRSFSSGVSTVALYVTVVGDGGTLTSGLTASDFEVRDGGEMQRLTHFQAGALPITMAVLLDDSPSAQGAKALTQSAAAALIRRMTPQDRLALGVFNRSVRMRTGLTNDQNELLGQVQASDPLMSGTAMWDAVHAGLATVGDEGGRRVVLVLSDGDDNSSEVDPSRVAQQTLEEGVLIYGIGVRGLDRRLSASLKELALATGGWFFELKNRDNLAATFQRVADELRAQYLLGFSPQSLDGKVHRIDVRVKRRGLTARTRTRYLASASANPEP